MREIEVEIFGNRAKGRRRRLAEEMEESRGKGKDRGSGRETNLVLLTHQ
jgi:hypothetical protein